MGAYITRRLIQSIIVILIVSVLVFVGMRMLPGDPIFMLYNPNQLQNFTEQELNDLRHEAGLDKPLAMQYFDWLGGVFKGNLGASIMTKQPIMKELSHRIPVTAYIGMLAFLLSIRK